MSALLLRARFIPVTSLTLPNKHKGPHKSDLQRFISLEGTAHQLSPVKHTKTSSLGGNLVHLYGEQLVPDTAESIQARCFLLLRPNPQLPRTCTWTKPCAPPSCCWSSELHICNLQTHDIKYKNSTCHSGRGLSPI